MTDEPREETRPEDEEVEGHGGVPNLDSDKHGLDEDDDVEAHSPPTPRPPTPIPPTP
jgi:hypothetical protein